MTDIACSRSSVCVIGAHAPVSAVGRKANSVSRAIVKPLERKSILSWIRRDTIIGPLPVPTCCGNQPGYRACIAVARPHTTRTTIERRPETTSQSTRVAQSSQAKPSEPDRTSLSRLEPDAVGAVRRCSGAGTP